MRLGVFAVSSFLLVGSVWGISHHPARAPQERNAGPVRVSLPLKSWALVVDLPGFTIDTNGVQPDGRLYLKASNKATGVIFSVFLENSPQPATPEECGRSLQSRSTRTRPEEKGKRNVRFSSLGPMTLLFEDHLFEFQGSLVSQSNVFACMPKDNVYIDIHLSKMELKPGEDKLFTEILQSARIEQVQAAVPPPEEKVAPSETPSAILQKQPAPSATPGMDAIRLADLMLAPDEVPKECAKIDGEFPVDMQTRLLSEPSGMQSMLPFLQPRAQKSQSFDCNGQKGTLYFFEYPDGKAREEAENFVRGYLWGAENKPTPAHPEQILHLQNVLIVSSFRTLQVTLARSLLAKMSTSQARDAKTGGFKDIGADLLASLSSRLNCGTPAASTQTQTACTWLAAFAAGDSPAALLGVPLLFIGRSMTFAQKENPEETDYESLLVLGGITDHVNYTAVRPDNEDERKDIEALIQAKASKSELPRNSAYQFILQPSPRRECKISPTAGRSLLLFADGGMLPVYLRRNGDSLYMVGLVATGPGGPGQSPFLIGQLQ